MITKPPLAETQRAMSNLLDALDVQQAATAEEDAERRTEPRPAWRAPCQLTLFTGPQPTIEIFHGTTRNLSFLGLSAVLHIRRESPIALGLPVEVAVSLGPTRSSYMAGTVAFCRPIDEGCWEVGVKVMAAGDCEIVTPDLAQARLRYDWLAAALQVPGY